MLKPDLQYAEYADEKEKVNKSDQELDQDFSKPWEQSDVILLVDGQQFHVHRVILAMSSPVFSRMFAAEFKEKNAEEIPLPEKKAEEIKEMLLTIYPSSLKPVNKNNCYFLLALAQEYQMRKLTEKCDDCLLQVVDKQQGVDVLDTIVVAQSYSLERVIAKCVDKTQNLSVGVLKSHKMYQQIEPLSQRKMIELQMLKVEKDVLRMKNLAGKALEDCNSVISVLGSHIRHANKVRDSYNIIAVKQNMKTVQQDGSGADRRSGICLSLSTAYEPLKDLHSSLKAISGLKADDL